MYMKLPLSMANLPTLRATGVGQAHHHSSNSVLLFPFEGKNFSNTCHLWKIRNLFKTATNEKSMPFTLGQRSGSPELCAVPVAPVLRVPCDG